MMAGQRPFASQILDCAVRDQVEPPSRVVRPPTFRYDTCRQHTSGEADMADKRCCSSPV
jgi:hypothetical protein